MLSRVSSTSCSKAVAPENFQVNEGNILDSGTSRYLILEVLGEGSFGKVAHCVNVHTAKEVALKIIKSKKSTESEREIEMLKAVSILDPVKTNVVQLFEKFEHEGHTCLAFEMLNKSLHDFMVSRSGQPLSLNEIRPIAQQLLSAFDALKGIGVLHVDLKPDNVMLVNHDKQPFRVKLIDFGLALKTSELRQGMIMSIPAYRAPEVYLGLPLSEAIDMWALGCLLAQLYISNYLFGTDCEYNVMDSIVSIVGQPADHLLNAGWFTREFFKENRHWDDPKWWMKTELEYQLETGTQPIMYPRTVASLDDLVILYSEIEDMIEIEDRRAFVSLLKGLLQTDPERRIRPGRALKHPFISVVHLKEELGTSPYVEEALKKMSVIPHYTPEEGPTPKTKTEEVITEGGQDISSAAPGSHSPGSFDGVSNMPDGAPAVEGSHSPGSFDGTSRIPDGAPAVEGSHSPGSFDGISNTPDGAPAVERSHSPGSFDGISNMPDGAPAVEGSHSPGFFDGVSNMPDGAPAVEGSHSPGFFDGVSNMPDGAPVAEGTTPIQHEAEEELRPGTDGAVSYAIQPQAEEELRTNAVGSPDEAASPEARISPLKRIRKFFGRAIRTIFGRKRRSA